MKNPGDIERDPLTRALERVAETNERLAVSVEALRAELLASRKKKVSTRRVKALRAAELAGADFPVDDLAAMQARRALAKLRSSR